MRSSRALAYAAAFYLLLALSPGRNFELLREGDLRVLFPSNHIPVFVVALVVVRFRAVWISRPPRWPRIRE
jgi:hypothetical protein